MNKKWFKNKRKKKKKNKTKYLKWKEQSERKMNFNKIIYYNSLKNDESD